MRFCKENDIECVNFSLARPELYPRKTDEYYFDLYHMVGDGSDIFSYCFSKFFNAFKAGEDTSGWFYSGKWEYLQSVTVIPNCWIQTYHPEEDWNMAWEPGRADRQRRQRKRRAGTCIWPTATTAQASRRNTASSFATNPRERKPR